MVPAFPACPEPSSPGCRSQTRERTRPSRFRGRLHASSIWIGLFRVRDSGSVELRYPTFRTLVHSKLDCNRSASDCVYRSLEVPCHDVVDQGLPAVSTRSCCGGSTAEIGAVPGPCRVALPIRDGHQFHRPSSSTVEGTRTVRTMKVSIKIPTAKSDSDFAGSTRYRLLNRRRLPAPRSSQPALGLRMSP